MEKGGGWDRPRSSRALVYTAWGTYSCWQERAFSRKALTLQMSSVIWILSRNPCLSASGSRGRPWPSPFGQGALEVLWLPLWPSLCSYLQFWHQGVALSSQDGIQSWASLEKLWTELLRGLPTLSFSNNNGVLGKRVLQSFTWWWGCWALTRDCVVPSLCLPLHPPPPLTEGPLSASLLDTVLGRVGGHEPHLSMQKISPSSQSGARCGQGPRWINEENYSDVPSLGQTASSVRSNSLFLFGCIRLVGALGIFLYGARTLFLVHRLSCGALA